MNALVILLVGSLAVCSNASVIGLGGLALVGPAAPGAILKGPSDEATILGPDGSAISSAVSGGAIVAPATPGGVVSAAVAPGIVAHTEILGVAPALHAPAIVGGPRAVLVGPSGTVVAPGVLAPGILGHGLVGNGLVGHGLVGHGIW